MQRLAIPVIGVERRRNRFRRCPCRCLHHHQMPVERLVKRPARVLKLRRVRRRHCLRLKKFLPSTSRSSAVRRTLTRLSRGRSRELQRRQMGAQFRLRSRKLHPTNFTSWQRSDRGQPSEASTEPSVGRRRRAVYANSQQSRSPNYRGQLVCFTISD